MRTRRPLLSQFDRVHKDDGRNGGPQDVQDQARAGQEAAAEPLHPAVDANENWQHDQIQLEAENVAQNQARPLRIRDSDTSCVSV